MSAAFKQLRYKPILKLPSGTREVYTWTLRLRAGRHNERWCEYEPRMVIHAIALRCAISHSFSSQTLLIYKEKLAR